jgi:hypothetical protein
MFYRNLNYVTSSLDPSKLGSGFEEKSHEFTGFSKQLLRFFQLLSEQYYPDRINLYHAAYSITPSSDEINEYTPFSKTPNFTPVVLPHPDSLDFDQIWSFFPEETEEISEIRNFQRWNEEFQAEYSRLFLDDKVDSKCFNAFGIYMNKLRKYVDCMNDEMYAKSSKPFQPSSIFTSAKAKTDVPMVPKVHLSSVVTRGAILALSEPLRRKKITRY